ncbi:hypothetical protein BT63DRAFT_82344 [Microthyrium microscopicum]|uniref:Integral membrane protein n=1 Tax=Microthyrium microscopicum TaxID=703497 RepID=A0A6A6U1J7_9PEZI|nr:hypothetical protein BT63DRAFT_82344 [Microthyrium microscopicum]
MPAKAVVPFLVAMMLLTGVCNTLLTKYQDMQCVRNCDVKSHKKPVFFEQPVIQTLQMFIGEMGCWLVIAVYQLHLWVQKKRGVHPEASEAEPLLADSDDTLQDEDPLSSSLVLPHDGREHLEGWRVLLLALPACCDITGTTLMNVGLLFVAASIYQMTRGALVLFVGLFSVIFLKRRLGLYKWFALFVVVSGVAVVGLAGVITKDDKATPSAMAAIMNEIKSTLADEVPEAGPNLALRTLLGVFLIAIAQIFTATQFVIEESIMEKYSLEPLKAVGWEGIWGFVVTSIGMVILHFAYGQTDAGRYGYFDAKEGLREVFHHRAIAVSSVLIMISIGGFNFFGLSVTRTVSATSRSTIDTCRTLFIWVVSLGLGWETFKWLQVVGFALLVYGTFLFNDLVRPPMAACLPKDDETGEDMLD